MGQQFKSLGRERVRRGLTRVELARLAGVSYTYVTELESGAKLGGADAHRRLSAALAAVPVVVDLVSE